MTNHIPLPAEIKNGQPDRPRNYRQAATQAGYTTQDISRLLEEIERLKAEVDWLRAELERKS